MSASYDPWVVKNWYGKEFTVTGAIIVMILYMSYLPTHEIGHGIAYFIFGINAEFVIVTEPYFAFGVQASEYPILPIKLFASFFGGGFAGLVALIVSIKSRSSLLAAVFGFSAGISEMSFFLFSHTYGIDFLLFTSLHMTWYMLIPIITVVVVFVVGLPEVRWHLFGSKCIQ